MIAQYKIIIYNIFTHDIKLLYDMSFACMGIQ